MVEKEESCLKYKFSNYYKIKIVRIVDLFDNLRYGTAEYVAAAGTCQGDSGGPAFVDEGYHFVLTGLWKKFRNMLKISQF